jgi:hypothetical protein
MNSSGDPAVTHGNRLITQAGIHSLTGRLNGIPATSLQQFEDHLLQRLYPDLLF